MDSSYTLQTQIKEKLPTINKLPKIDNIKVISASNKPEFLLRKCNRYKSPEPIGLSEDNNSMD